MNDTQDTQPAYDVYVEEDRITFVKRPNEVIDSTPAQEPFRWVLMVMLGAHGLIAVLSLALVAYLAVIPASATVYALADRIPSVANVHSLPAQTMSMSKIVPTTGHVHVPATQARGLVVFYNSLTQPQVIDSGTLLVGADGESIVTDQIAYVPGGDYTSNGHARVWAHALNPGAEGNVRAGDISGPCCRQFVQVVNMQFAGGHDARDFQAVTQADISSATTAVLAQLQQSLQGRMASLLPPGDAVLTPVPCSTRTSSSKPVGAEANQVMVTIKQSCTPTAYSVRDLQRALASLIAGKTPEQARAILAGQGMVSTGIRLAWLHDRLPADVKQIRIVLLFH